jgi:hypothetical protein
MGVLKGLLDKGLIDMDEYQDLAEEFSDEFFTWRHELDPESLDRIIDELEDIGAFEAAEELTMNMLDLMCFWHDEILDKFGVEVYYDPKVDRWRDWYTGQFVRDPTYWVRD